MTRWVRVAALVLAGCAAPEPRISVDLEPSSPEFGQVVVEGLDRATTAALARLDDQPASWAAVLALYTEAWSPETPELPPVAGRWVLEGPRLRFLPNHPPVAGMGYTVRWQPPGAPSPRLIEVRVPAPVLAATTEILGVYPSAAAVPENLLKVYLQFSAAMRRGEAARRVRLLDASGTPVEAPFVAPEQELWDPATTRLTLILDPGRIKRGVGPNLELGAPLRAGQTYTLEIDPGWSDARGAPLRQGFTRRLEVGAADRVAPNVDGWELLAPANRDEPLVLRFPEPLDRALLESALEVRRADGTSIAGAVTIAAREQEWRFEPRAPWSSGSYELRVATVLEDLAGNSLRRPFETAYDAPSGTEPWLSLAFVVP